MFDDKRELNESEESLASGFGADGSLSEDTASPNDGAFSGGGFVSPSGSSGGVREIHAEEIVPEHLDVLPDIDHVEEYVGGDHVYDEETAGALVALMFAKTHQEPEQYTPPKATAAEPMPVREEAPPPSSGNPIEQPKKKKKKKKKSKLGCVIWLFFIGLIAAGCAWLFPEVNWDYVFGGFLNDTVIGDHNVTNSSTSFDYHVSYDGVSIDGVFGSRENIVIPETIDGMRVTAISACAFENNHDIRSICMPSTINRIGEGAFRNCENLEMVELGNVLNIDAQAFYRCYSLTNLTLPDCLEVISDNAFSSCHSLYTIVIPASVWMIGPNAFSSCGGIYIQCMVPEKPIDWADNWCDGMAGVGWTSDIVGMLDWSYVDGGVSIDKYNGVSFETICIPETINGYEVVRIGEGAFMHKTGITEIVIPDTVTEIGADAFFNCFDLKRINMPSNLKTIGRRAFYDTSIDNAELPYGLLEIGSEAFYYCSSLSEILIPDSVTDIGACAFDGYRTSVSCEADSPASGWVYDWNCGYDATYGNVMTLDEDDFTYYFIGNSVTITGYLGNRTKFRIPTYLDGYTVDTISHHAFLNNTAIKKVILPDTLNMIGNGAFRGCSSLEEIIIPSNVTEISESAFSNCTSLESVEMANGNLTYIGISVFESCTSLKDIRLPSSLHGIYSTAFKGCTALESIKIPGSVYVVCSEAFRGCSSLRYVELGYGVDEIEANAFRDCYNLATVAIPSTVLSIGDSAFANCRSLLSVRLQNSVSLGYNVFDGSPTEATREPVDYSPGISFSIGYAESGELYATVIGADYYLTELMIPAYYDGAPVREINYSAFQGRDQITRVVLPETLEIIGSAAFASCTMLEEIIIPAGVKEIGSDAFYNCVNLERAVILGAERIRENAFTYCSSLYDVTLPEGLLAIENAFEYCPELKEIYIPESVNEVNAYAFGGTYEIKVYTSRGEATELWGYSYGDFPETVHIYWNYDVPGVEDLDVTFTDEGAIINSVKAPGIINIPLHVAGVRVIVIGTGILDNNNQITEVRIPTTVVRINSRAFYGTSSLEYVYIPASVTAIEENAFLSASGYIIYCEVSERQVGWAEYWNNTGCDVVWNHSYLSAEDVYYYEIKEDIDGNKYASITGYKGTNAVITLPTHIGGYAVRDIASYAFSGNQIITSVTIPEGIEAIYSYAFTGCSNLEKVFLSTTLSEIYSYAFYNCASLNYIYFSEGLRHIGTYAFSETALIDVYLPSTVETIEGGAFSRCESLYGVSIPIGVTYVGSHVFDSSNNVTVYYEGQSAPEEWENNWSYGVLAIYYDWR